MQQARKRGGEEAGSTGPDEFEVKVHPLRMVPFIMILIIVPSYCLWLGRQEIFDAIGGARAYVYTSLLSTVTEVPVTEMPEDLVTQPKIDMAEPRVVTQTTVITEIVLKDGSKMQILDEPIPNDCYPEQHADYDGYAVQWGLGNKVKSAAECCRRCKEFVPSQEVPHGCNVWIWCGDPSGVCWTMDIHNHTTGDCWLKFQAGWDGITNRAATNLKVNHRHKFSEQFRSEHKSAPELIPWVAGLVQTPKPAAAGA